jgi:hypothetical protein
MRLKKLDWGLILAILLPLIAALPTWGNGIAAGADVAVHVHRIHAMTEALQTANLWPRWISYLHLGYGYPIFNYYAPGYVYFTSLFELAGLPIALAYNIVQSLFWSVGSVGMYLLARRFLPVQAAVLAAAIWVLAPSRLYEVWYQGSLAQIVGAAFIPFLLLGVVKTSKTPSLRNMLWIALPYAALILSHTPMLYISTLFAAPLALLSPLSQFDYAKYNYRDVFKAWLIIGLGFVLGIGLASIFLMPTLLELRYVTISAGLDETINYLREQFIPITEIFAWPRPLDSTDLYLDLPRTLGLVGGILSAFGFVALFREKRYALAALTGLGLLFTVFMLLDISFPIWLSIPGFANLRFPARLLRMGAIIVALLGGASLLLLPKRWQNWGLVGGLLLLTAQIIPMSKPYEHWLNWENISAYDEILHERQARTYGTVSYDEFNPVWGERIFLDAPTDSERYINEPFHLSVFGRDIAATNWQGITVETISDNTLKITTDEARAIRFRQYFFPGWQAIVDEQIAEIYPDEEIGLITIDLAVGEHMVTLEYVGTPVQKIAAVISGISLIIVILIWRLGKNEEREENEILSFRESLGFLALILVLAFTNQFIQSNNGFKYQSPATEPHYMQTRLDTSFGNEITLLGYTLHNQSIAFDSPLRIDLYWHLPEAIPTNYRPVVQLINLSQSAAWATSSNLQPAAGEFSAFLPNRFARDPYALRLADENTPPFVGQIMIQLVGENGMLILADGSDRLILPELIQVKGMDSPAKLTQTPYQFGDVIQLWCVTISTTEETITVDLIWHTMKPSERDLVVMLHGLDEAGNFLIAGDAPPFSGDYPAYFWRGGQTIHEVRSLPNQRDIEQIAIGLYTRDTVERLPVTQASDVLPDNQLILSLDSSTCQP